MKFDVNTLRLRSQRLFDRVRENMHANPAKDADDLKEIANKSINQTLSRSINTSVTTFVMVFLLWLLGVTSIKDFALPLMVGVISGTYSSICIAVGLWFTFKKNFGKKAKTEKNAKKNKQ